MPERDDRSHPINLPRRWLQVETAITLKAVLIATAACDEGVDASGAADLSSITGEFTFVQITDFHLDDDPQHLRFLKQAINEINTLAPDFVVFTGDLIDAGETLTIKEAKDRYALGYSLIDALQMPVYLALGNHDIVGRRSVGADPSDPAFGKGLFTAYFGPTYYAFDWKGTRCIVLDPHDLDGGQLQYRISMQQRRWLEEELKQAKNSPLLVFFHEPSTDWENQEVIALLKNALAIFSGHLHFSVRLDSQGIPEQVTGALCGEWWYGPGPEGRLPGYRIVRVNNSGIFSTYREVGRDPEPYLPLTTPIIHDEAIPIDELLDNFPNIQGTLATIEGTVGLMIKGPPFLAEGVGAFLFRDDSGTIGVLTETPDETFDSLKPGDRIKVAGVPLQYGLKWLMRSEHSTGFERLASILPKKMIVSDENGAQGIRLMRWFRKVS